MAEQDEGIVLLCLKQPTWLQLNIQAQARPCYFHSLGEHSHLDPPKDIDIVKSPNRLILQS